MKLIKNLNELKYLPFKFRIDIGLITLFILVKTYFMVLIIGLLFMLKMDLTPLDPMLVVKLVKLLFNLCCIEVITIFIDLVSPLIYNLYVKIRLMRGK